MAYIHESRKGSTIQPRKPIETSLLAHVWTFSVWCSR